MTRAIIVAALAASAVAAALSFPPAKPSRLADEAAHPSGRRHINDCPLRYGIGADVEAAWR